MTRFANIGEKSVTKAIVRGFADELLEYVGLRKLPELV